MAEAVSGPFFQRSRARVCLFEMVSLRGPGELGTHPRDPGDGREQVKDLLPAELPH